MQMKVWKKAIFVLLLIVLSLLFLSPILLLLNSSFKDLKEIYLNVLALPSHFGLDNYKEAFEKLDFMRSFMNSLVITIVSTVLIVLVSSMAAWVLVRYNTRMSKFLFMLFAASMLIPFQCVMLPLVDFMSDLNLMNRPGIVFMYVGFGCSMSIVLYHGFIKNIPLELEEAATLDGCSTFRMFFSVVFPLLKTITVTVAILNVKWIWNDFLLPNLIINRAGWQTLPLKTYLFFGQFTKNWDLATAGLILCMIPIIIFYVFCQRYIVKGVTDGAVKG